MTAPADVKAVSDLVRTAELANKAMREASEQLRIRDQQVEVALDALLVIVEGGAEPRKIAGQAVLEMRALRT